MGPLKSVSTALLVVRIASWQKTAKEFMKN